MEPGNRGPFGCTIFIFSHQYLHDFSTSKKLNLLILSMGILSAHLSINSIPPPFFKVIYLKAEGVIAFLNRCSLDEMGLRIDELEQSINDLKAEMGSDGMTTPSKTKDEGSKPADSSA